jgi:hypothetical protein
MASKRGRAAPKEVQILGQRFQILLRKPKKEDYGECFALPRRIELNSDLSAEEIRAVCIHEAFHGAMAVSGLTELVPHKVEEALAVMMEHFAEDLVQIWGEEWGKSSQ